MKQIRVFLEQGRTGEEDDDMLSYHTSLVAVMVGPMAEMLAVEMVAEMAASRAVSSGEKRVVPMAALMAVCWVASKAETMA